MLTARDALVRARGNLIRATRSLLRSEGRDLPSADGDDFGRRLMGTWGIPEGQEGAVVPLAEAIESITSQVLQTEKTLEEVAKENEEVVRRMRRIPGVGRLTAPSPHRQPWTSRALRDACAVRWLVRGARRSLASGRSAWAALLDGRKARKKAHPPHDHPAANLLLD